MHIASTMRKRLLRTAQILHIEYAHAGDAEENQGIHPRGYSGLCHGLRRLQAWKAAVESASRIERARGLMNRQSRHAPEAYKATEAVEFIAEHLRNEDEYTQVSLSCLFI